MSDGEYTVDPNLWNLPTSGGGGAFWRPKEGGYRGKLVRFEQGPEFENTKERKNPETGEKEKVKVKELTVRWVFEVYRLSNGKRVTYTVEEGDDAGQTKDAFGDGLTSRAFSKDSKTGKWLAALGVEVDWPTLNAASPEEQRAMQARYMQSAIGRMALISFAKNKADNVALSEVSKLDEGDDDDE